MEAKDEEEYRRDLDTYLLTLSAFSEHHDLLEGLQRRCKEIERAMLTVGEKHRQLEAWAAQGDTELREGLRKLIAERKVARKAGSVEVVKRISRLIKKEIRAIARARKSAKISKILEELKDLKRIAGIRGNDKKVSICAVLDKDGKQRIEQDDIADVFAEFFESPYKADGTDGQSHTFHCRSVELVRAVTREEVRSELNKMRPRKAADESGLVSELLRSGSDLLMDMVAQVFTAVLNPQAAIPDYWKASSIRVLFKKGDERLPENYRPICIIPILYKLFSKVVLKRIRDHAISEQSPDQAGFRPDYSCDDHLFAITVLAEKCNEFNLPLWIATLDFRKAFDSISHDSIWRSLSAQGIPDAYVHTICKLYQGQRATVKCGSTSRKFGIGKGTKQGDPISPVIFNAVLEQIMRPVKEKWLSKGWGQQLGYGQDCVLTNLRFADDILLVGRSLYQIKQMLADVRREGAKVGLELHPEKTKIQHNGIGYGSCVRSAKIDGMDIEVLPSTTTTTYLGKALSLTDTHDSELKHRLAKAWAKFGAYRQELTNKDIPLSLRLKLFESVVTPSVLYGSCSWVMTSARKQALKSAQMKMVRTILSRRRLVTYPSVDDGDSVGLETWVDWVRRVTADARKEMANNGVPDWVDECGRTIQRWGKKFRNMESYRWARRVLDWQPDSWRARGRPRARWSDQLHALSP